MLRLQVEAHVGAVTNPEAVKQAGYTVAIQSRKARPGYPIILVGERIYTASDGTLDKKFCVTANETYSHRDGTFGIEEAHVISDLLKKHFVDTKLARIVRVCVTVFMSPRDTQSHLHGGRHLPDQPLQVDPTQPRCHHHDTQDPHPRTRGLTASHWEGTRRVLHFGRSASRRPRSGDASCAADGRQLWF